MKSDTAPPDMTTRDEERSNDLWTDLPGGAFVRQGVTDFVAGNRTIPACLVAIGRTRLSRAGVLPTSAPAGFAEPERELYHLLCLEGGDAYGRYNSLLREFISFEQALDRLR